MNPIRSTIAVAVTIALAFLLAAIVELPQTTSLNAQVTTGPARSGASASATIFTNTPATGQHPEATGTGGIGKWVWSTNTLGFTIDGGGATITTGTKGYLEIPYSCTIIRVTLLADQSGSATVEPWKCTFSQFDAGSTHPVSGDSMVGAGVKPLISSSTKGQDTDLSDWTTVACTAGDIITFNITAPTSIQRINGSFLVIH